MDEKKNNYKSVGFCFLVGITLALALSLLLRPYVKAHAQEMEVSTNEQTTENIATNSDSHDNLQIATNSDADYSPYLTDNMQVTGILLSIRNLLVCIWGSLLVGFLYFRMLAIIHRLSGERRNK